MDEGNVFSRVCFCSQGQVAHVLGIRSGDPYSGGLVQVVHVPKDGSGGKGFRSGGPWSRGLRSGGSGTARLEGWVRGSGGQWFRGLGQESGGPWSVGGSGEGALCGPLWKGERDCGQFAS